MSAEATITAQRKLAAESTAGTRWKVVEFEGGNVLLVADTAATYFSAHFSAEQWAEFQTLIAGQS